MKRGNVLVFRWVSIFFILLAVLLTVFQLVTYSRIRVTFSPGTVIAGIPVGGLDRQQAADRLIQAYSLPIEVRYNDALIQIKPSTVGFKLDLETMLTAADQQRINQPFWIAFWYYLWNQLPVPSEVPLRASFSEDLLRNFLQNEIAARYDQTPSAAAPIPGSTAFRPGQAGTKLDIDRAVTLISDALRNSTNRVVNLTYNKVNPTRPSFLNLQVMLQQVINVSGFDGVAELYLQDLQTGQEINFALQNGQVILPDISFTAASTMKIPIMISVFKQVNEPAPANITGLIESMIELSENDPADRLMEDVIDPRLGPLQVTDDLQALGMKNTFLAGFFYPGAPLLRRYSTQANQRSDVSTNPDPYNQTTPSEIGMLLNDVYLCAQNGGGSLAAVFPGKITQNECRLMISYMTKNQIAVLLQAGLPEGTQIAHKHGWITDVNDGYIHTISDAGIIYTPGGNYIFVAYLYHPVQLLFEPANQLIAELSQAVYNYYNLSGR